MKTKHLLLCGLIATSPTVFGNPVVVKMNAVSTTMTLAERESGQPIEIPAPINREYSLDLEPGRYVLSAYGTDGKTLNGTLTLLVTDSLTTQQYTVITCTAYVTNKGDDGKTWNVENGDYTLDVSVNTREGVPVEQTPGKSTTANRYTFLALNGNSYNAAFVPSEGHREEGFMTLYRGGTLTANVNVSGAIPTGAPFGITVPADADLQLGIKFTHFTDFTPVDPDEIETGASGKTYRYTLASGQVYNYRTWKAGGLTHGGYFTMNADASKRPEIGFTEADYAKYDPKAVNHDAHSNNGYETGDLLLNINPEHHLRLADAGDTFLVHGMRMWELSDNSTNNYFIEPDLHYAVLDTDFKPSDEVISIVQGAENGVHGSAWSTIKAKSKGTAIVLVTYDGINLNYYNNADKKDYLGGEYWGAIWPENTGVFVVTVGAPESTAKPNMTLNEDYNQDALRLAGMNVDAEHDVFYYLDDEDGYPFTFTPEGVAAVSVARPVFTGSGVRYDGFSTQGVEFDAVTGTYTVLLGEGRNIVRMTDTAGTDVYQVLRAKPCHREITNETRPGSSVFQPGDRVKIQYSGLFHPANKIAGIYNMSAYVTYNGIPNGSSLILGSGQYTFGSAPSAQAVIVEIPDDYDAAGSPVLVMDRGVIQVNGYGDPIGNHRNTSPTTGRSPNFTAVPHKTYFGSIPDIAIAVTPVRYFNITLKSNVDDAEIKVVRASDGQTVEPVGPGRYSGTYGTYRVMASKAGFRCFRRDFTIADDDGDDVTFDVAMVPGTDDMWDGSSVVEVTADGDGVYRVRTGAELAYIAGVVASRGKDFTARVELDADIDLGDYDWTPVGDSSKTFSAKFDGKGHAVYGVYVDRPSTNYAGLFGYAKGTAGDIAAISNVSVHGTVVGKQYVGGIVGNLNAYARVEGCANMADVNAASYAGGIAGYVASASECAVVSCYNHGDIAATSYVGGITGLNNASATIANVYSIGTVTGPDKTTGACVGGTNKKDNVSGAYTTRECGVTEGHILVTDDEMASGAVAYALGLPFTQLIGTDPYPVFGSKEVLYDPDTDTYFNNGMTSVGQSAEFGVQDYDRLEVYDALGRPVILSAECRVQSAESVQSSGCSQQSEKAVVQIAEDAVQGYADVLRGLAPGLYIVRSGSSIRKIIIR